MLATVASLEEVLAAPDQYFGELAGELARYAAGAFQGGAPENRGPVSRRGETPGAGAPQPSRTATPFIITRKWGWKSLPETARRLRLSQAEAKTVATLIRLHMRPFLLLPAFRERELTFRALGRLVRAARFELPGLFALAMADSLAGQGSQKPPDSEAVLADLADEAYRFLKDRLEPQDRHPRLINGHDLMRLGLKPGPLFRLLLTAVEEAQWEGVVHTREEALKLAQRLAGLA